ncbi:MAG: pentapeptide repeat-containing protein [Nitrosopumilus sp.]|nr:pentapeptide repeat-containing protein [Nitrosopumilus sp.]
MKLIGEINKNHYSLDDFKFFSAKFQDASLKNANFRGANLDGAIFIGVKNFEKAIFDNGEPWHRLIDAYKLEDLKPDEGG